MLSCGILHKHSSFVPVYSRYVLNDCILIPNYCPRRSDLKFTILGDSFARGPKLLSIKNYVIEIMTWKWKWKNDAKQDLLIIDAKTGLLSHPSTLECVSPNSGILFPNLFGASSERITLYNEMHTRPYGAPRPAACTVLKVRTVHLGWHWWANADNVVTNRN